MTYTLTFTHHGKSYSNFQVNSDSCLPHQYEAVACGLLLWKIEHENLSRDDKYHALRLIEYDEKKAESKEVWTAEEYIPYSTEVK